MEIMIQAQVLIPGEVAGELIVSKEPLSFWGGYDPETGEITDRRHPLSGVIAAGKILALPLPFSRWHLSWLMNFIRNRSQYLRLRRSIFNDSRAETWLNWTVMA
jgi:hypothetical protein